MNEVSPNTRPGEDSDLYGVMALGFREEMLDINDMLPAKIVAWDSSKNRAQVEILYLVTMTDGSVNAQTAPAEVPTFVMGTGKFALVWPLNPGDLGWIKATDRDMSLFFQHYDAQAGNTPRIHSFEDAIFIPDAMKDFVVVEPDGVSLQTLDGINSVSVSESGIKLVAGSTTLTITDAGIVANKPIEATNFTDGSVKLIGHIHTDSSGDTIGPARNP